MTSLYRPVLIESAKQAEALPVGTLILRRGDSGPWQKVANRHMNDHYRGDGAAIGDPGIVGSQALVPVEVEEVRALERGALERDEHGATVLTHTPDAHPSYYRRTEFHTPWEEA